MSGLNVSLGYFLAVLALSEVARRLLRRLSMLRGFSAELPASFMLVACWHELRTLMEVGAWAGGFGPDVSVTLLFLILVVHGICSQGASGNPTVTLQSFLLLKVSPWVAFSSLVGQFAGAALASALAIRYWILELTDMHMIQNMMSQDCSAALQVSVPQGAFAEGVCAFFYHLLALRLRHSTALFRVPLTALTITLLTCAASSYTTGLFNPALAFALTFHCSGYTLQEYATVYWLGPITGMTLALFLYQGHIPRLFSRNLLYSQKSRYRVPQAKTAQDQGGRTKEG
ncbi:aquaporin 12 isoform X1 [Huso huso]|uniref:Aquaporin n=1 Tax=Huso huso TaxID=61971 RepID=A0ABR0Z191_HUSHU